MSFLRLLALLGLVLLPAVLAAKATNANSLDAVAPKTEFEGESESESEADLDSGSDADSVSKPTTPSARPRQYPPPMYGGCPLCDSSVYSYCSHRLLHDSCCCDFPGVHYRPPQCAYTDCSLLFAKSCYEYSLIKNCCCNSPY